MNEKMMEDFYLQWQKEEADRKPTNSEKIRAMTDEELAECLYRPCSRHRKQEDCNKPIDYPCLKCITEWLKEEVNE